ncbi:hypothetical protein [Catenovulum maritimum]|uniref:DUF4178 domain-containing protein n=1 Tax=Catenovulum maritimum TaxID=1513271 RepID=A0A0J8GTK2_9ALTE|nr:hypothetical protein [Catenovulum maritimum]KMT64013.1 hypothetical protein XM47_16610 [Catenovulum maritimum]
MGFLSSLFGGKKEENIRHLTHLSQLKITDVITFSDSFALPDLLRKQSFKVEEVNSYQYEKSSQIEFVLQGSGSVKVYVTVEKDDEEWANISVKINREQVSQVFDLDNFSEIFDDEIQTELKLTDNPNEYHNWVAPVYFQNAFAQRGYFYAKDFRPGKPPLTEDRDSEAFDYFRLTSADEQFSVEIEVWEDGDTDVLLTIHRPLTDIADMYPGTIDD